MDIDASRGRAVVLDGAAEAVVAVDLTTGARSMISDAAVDADTPLANAFGLAWDAEGDRALVSLWQDGALAAIDGATGQRSVLSDANTAGQQLGMPTVLAVDADSGVVLVLDAGREELVSVELATGAVATVGTGDAVGRAVALAVVGPGVYDIVNTVTDALYTVTAAGGTTLVADNSVPYAPSDLHLHPSEIARDLAGDQRVLLDEDRVLTVDGDTGALDVLVDEGLDDLIGAAFSPDGASLYLLDVGARTVFEFDSQALVVLSGPAVPSSDTPFDVPISMALDVEGKRLLVGDNPLDAILAVDTTTGVRSVLSSPTVPDMASPIQGPADVEVDPVAQRLIVADFSQDALIEVDLATGARRPLASVDNPVCVDLDTEAGLALVASSTGVSDGGQLWLVDLDSGASTQVMGHTGFPPENELRVPAGMLWEPDRGIAWMAHDSPGPTDDVGQLQVVDLHTGQRVVVAR